MYNEQLNNSKCITKLTDELSYFRAKYGKFPELILINPINFLGIIKEYLNEESKISQLSFFQGIKVICASFVSLNDVKLIGNKDIEINRIYN